MLHKLRDARKKAGYTQKQMATKLKISKQLYSQIERGEVRLVYDRAVEIAAILGTTPDALFLDKKSIENGQALTATGTE